MRMLIQQEKHEGLHDLGNEKDRNLLKSRMTSNVWNIEVKEH